jgi:hypothetical protein
MSVIRKALALENESPISVSAEVIEGDTEFILTARSAWARLINKVYEVDPFICPHCGGEMQFIAVIEEAPVALQSLMPKSPGSPPWLLPIGWGKKSHRKGPLRSNSGSFVFYSMGVLVG